MRAAPNPEKRATSSVARAIARNSFCVLASSAGDGPHAVGVMYVAVDGVLYVATLNGSKKVRNIRDNQRVALCIPVRRYPLVPPFAVQFDATAEVVARDDPRIEELLRARRLKKITAHGELDDPRTCFLRMTPARRVSTYGVGVPLRELLRDPLGASRSFDLGAV